MKKSTIFFLIIILLSLSSCREKKDNQKVVEDQNKDKNEITENQIPLKDELEEAITLAKKEFQSQKSKNIDLSNGPCISNDLMPNWVADIAHHPRTKADNKKANQCQAFLQQTAQHFVELDPDGNLIRAI